MIAQKVKIIGVNILYHRRIKHWTQEELARRAGISKSYLSQIERGTFEKDDGCASLSTLYRIADALNVPVERLLSDR